MLKFYYDQKNQKHQFYTLQLKRWKAELRGVAIEPLLIFAARIPQEVLTRTKGLCCFDLIFVSLFFF